MNSEVFFYSTPTDRCSCVGEDGQLSDIGILYREIWTRFSKDEKMIDILKSMNMKTCCRMRFLSLVNMPMIDRSVERIVDKRPESSSTIRSADIRPKLNPPDFPLLTGEESIDL